jgi:hypothetical protein
MVDFGRAGGGLPLEATDRKGSVEVLALAPVAGTTTVYATRVDLPALDLPLSFRYSAADALGNAYANRALAGSLRTAEISTGLSLPGGVYHLLSFPALGTGTLEALAGGLPPAGTWGLYELDRDALRFRATSRRPHYAFRHDRTTAVAPARGGRPNAGSASPCRAGTSSRPPVQPPLRRAQGRWRRSR